MNTAARIVIFLLRAERDRLRTRPGTALRIAEISIEIQARLFTL